MLRIGVLLAVLSGAVSAADLMGSVINRVLGGGATDVVMWVIQENESRPQDEVTTYSVRQFNKEFEPRVLAVPQGSTVYFPNEDPFFHNIFSHNPSQSLDLGKYKGQSRPVVFQKAGVYPIGCEIHPWMSAFVVVAEAPVVDYFADANRYRISGLNPGKAVLHVWSPELNDTLRFELELKDGMNVRLIDFNKEDLKRRRRSAPRREEIPKESYEP